MQCVGYVLYRALVANVVKVVISSMQHTCRTKNSMRLAVLRHSWALPNDLKHNGASFLTISTALLCLRVARIPRYRDLVIFVPTYRQTD